MTQLLLRVTVDNSDPMIMFTNLMRYSRHVNLSKAQISQSAAFCCSLIVLLSGNTYYRRVICGIFRDILFN